MADQRQIESQRCASSPGRELRLSCQDLSQARSPEPCRSSGTCIMPLLGDGSYGGKHVAALSSDGSKRRWFDADSSLNGDPRAAVCSDRCERSTRFRITLRPPQTGMSDAVPKVTIMPTEHLPAQAEWIGYMRRTPCLASDKPKEPAYTIAGASL
jgi:hypothetical protein